MKALIWLAFGFLIVSLFALRATAQAWVEPQDTTLATENPDLYAWKLFIALNWPADPDKRQADSTKPFGDNSMTVWESWKLSSGKSGIDQVFLDDGSDPGPWSSGSTSSPSRFNDLEDLPLQQTGRIRQLRKGGNHPLFEPTVAQSNENHMNMDAYNFIRDKQLYNIEGQLVFFTKAEQLRAAAVAAAAKTQESPDESTYRKKLIDFPPRAKEIKAQWRVITEADEPRYHWAQDPKTKKIYGLTALHITTKDLPNWFWVTFEHVDNPNLAGAEPWILPSKDSVAGPNGFPEKMGIDGTVWANYRLRGTQIDFVDSTGRPTLLANSQIEQGFQQSASCISCHALAAIGAQGERPEFFQLMNGDITVSPNGAPDQSIFEQKYFVRFGQPQDAEGAATPRIGRLLFLQEDFVWSLMRAHHKSHNN